MGKIYEIIIEKDESVKDSIEQYVLDKGWVNAYISGAIGSVHHAVLKSPNAITYPPQASAVNCYMPSEVLSFTGEVMAKNLMPAELRAVYEENASPLFIHIHASLAATGAHVYGGGLHDAQAFRSLKVYIQPIES